MDDSQPLFRFESGPVNVVQYEDTRPDVTLHLTRREIRPRSTYWPAERREPYISLSLDTKECTSLLFLSLEQAEEIRGKLATAISKAKIAKRAA
jgi:hypothetical protein